MRFRPAVLIRNVAVAFVLSVAPLHGALATGTGSSTDLQADPAPCVAAAAANDADRIVAICGALIDNSKTAKTDRIKALIARAGAFDRKDMIDSAISDYDAALRSTRRLRISSISGANSGAGRATAGARWPISLRPSS
jgi:hypothetical protein